MNVIWRCCSVDSSRIHAHVQRSLIMFLFFTALTSHHWLNGKKWFHGARAKQTFKKKFRLVDSPIAALHRFLTSNELI